MGDIDDFLHGSTTLSGTSRDAERLIEQRIAELRAAALGPMELDAGWAAEPTAPDVSWPEPAPAQDHPTPPATAAAPVPHEPVSHEPSAHEPIPREAVSHEPRRTPPPPARVAPARPPADALLRPLPERTGPAASAAPSQPRGLGQPGELIASSLARLETGLQEDLARIEVMLRSMGGSRDAARVYGEQVLIALSELGQQLGSGLAQVAGTTAELGRQLEQGGPRGDGSEQLVKQVAAWSVELEQTSAAQSHTLHQQLKAVAERIEATRADTARALELAREETTRALEDTRRATIGSIDATRDLLSRTREDEGRLIEQAVDRATDRVLGAVSSLQEELDTGRHASQRPLDQLGESVTALHHRVDKHAANQAAMARQVAEELGAALAQRTAELERRFADQAALLERADRRVASAQEDVHRLRTDAPGIVEQAMEDTLHVAHQDLLEQVDEQAGSRHAELVAALAQIESHVQESVAALEQRVAEQLDQHGRQVTHVVTQSIGQLVPVIEALRDRQHKDAQVTRDTMRAELGAMRHELIGELDTTRVRSAEETELVVDSMAQGWQAVIAMLQSTDARMARLEALLGDD